MRGHFGSPDQARGLHDLGQVLTALREAAKPGRAGFEESLPRAHAASQLLARTFDLVLTELRQVGTTEGLGALLALIDEYAEDLGPVLGECMTGVTGRFGVGAEEAADALQRAGVLWSPRTVNRRFQHRAGSNAVLLIFDQGDQWDFVYGEDLKRAEGQFGFDEELLSGLLQQSGADAAVLLKRPQHRFVVVIADRHAVLMTAVTRTPGDSTSEAEAITVEV